MRKFHSIAALCGDGLTYVSTPLCLHIRKQWS
jgi:hypothetical protein